jgi:hypothetical protein
MRLRTTHRTSPWKVPLTKATPARSASLRADRTVRTLIHGGKESIREPDVALQRLSIQNGQACLQAGVGERSHDE